MGSVATIGERALGIKEAAALLRVSYSTVYAHKESLGFFRVGAAWRVWPEKLHELTCDYNSVRPAQAEQEKLCLSENAGICGSLTSASQTERELDALLAQGSAKKQRNITTS